MTDTTSTKSGMPIIHIAKSATEMGRKAADDIACELRRRLKVQTEVRMIFAIAPTQSKMLEALVQEPDINWTRVTAFHMDEYLGLQQEASQRFSFWLRRIIFDRLPFATVYLIEPKGGPEIIAASYARKLAEGPIDIVCFGIGSNGHLAFNDPLADFDDIKSVKVVELDDLCRQQRVDDGCFSKIEDVPTHAITVTVPRLLAADRLFCCAPGRLKRGAVRRALRGPIGPACPATALRLHPHCILYLDPESAAGLC